MSQINVDRFMGSLVGLAIGDAIGKQVEFRRIGTFRPVTDMNDGGTYRDLSAGQWTDDTSLCLCIAKSLVEKKKFDLIDQLQRFFNWREFGYLSSSGHLFDIGTTTSVAISLFSSSHKAICGSRSSLGNGSLMRLSPIPLFYFKYPLLAIQVAGLSSLSTHAADGCIDSCRYMAALIIGALQGASKAQLCSPFFLPNGVPTDYWNQCPLCPLVARVASGSFTQLNPPEIQGSGKVDLSLEAALWAFYHSNSFEDGVLNAVNLGDDSDTTAAIYGQLAGAYYSKCNIRQDWVDKISQSCMISSLARQVYELGQSLSTDGFSEVGIDGRVVRWVDEMRIVHVLNDSGLLDDRDVVIQVNDSNQVSDEARLDRFIIKISEDLEKVWMAWKTDNVRPNYARISNEILQQCQSIADDGEQQKFRVSCLKLVDDFESRNLQE